MLLYCLEKNLKSGDKTSYSKDILNHSLSCMVTDRDGPETSGFWNNFSHNKITFFA